MQTSKKLLGTCNGTIASYVKNFEVSSSCSIPPVIDIITTQFDLLQDIVTLYCWETFR